MYASPGPLGGARGFHPPYILGCYVTKSAPHKALKLIVWCKLTFDGPVVLHRVAASLPNVSLLQGYLARKKPPPPETLQKGYA